MIRTRYEARVAAPDPCHYFNRSVGYVPTSLQGLRQSMTATDLLHGSYLVSIRPPTVRTAVLRPLEVILRAPGPDFQKRS